MMAVQLKEQAPPPHDWRGQPCCKDVRATRGLVKRRETALLVSAHAINGTKDANDELIIEAQVPIHDLNLEFNNSRDEFDDKEAIYNRNVDTHNDADEEVNRVYIECHQPQPPANCAQTYADAVAAAAAANQTVIASKRLMDAAQEQNDIDKQRLSAAKEALTLAEVRSEAAFGARFLLFVARSPSLLGFTLGRCCFPQEQRNHDVKICEDDEAKLLQEKQEAQEQYGKARTACPGLCSGVPPPPPTRKYTSTLHLRLSSGAVLTASAGANSGAW